VYPFISYKTRHLHPLWAVSACEQQQKQDKKGNLNDKITFRNALFK
jgi:hypothetical protein